MQTNIHAVSTSLRLYACIHSNACKHVHTQTHVETCTLGDMLSWWIGVIVCVACCIGTIFRLKGAILAMSFLDCNGILIPTVADQWKDVARDERKAYNSQCLILSNGYLPDYGLAFIHSFRLFLHRLFKPPLLLRGAPDYSTDTVSKFTCQSATGNCKWRTCPRFLRCG